MWVRSEYAGELAVLSAWLCALLPWSVSYGSGHGIRLIRVHFLYVYFQFAPGSGLSNLLDTTVLVSDAAGFADNTSAALGYRLWTFGMGIVTLALALSVAYYRLDEGLEVRSPVDPVRVMGGLLVAAAVPLAAATYFAHVGLYGFTVPVGVLFMLVLGGSLLLVERADDMEATGSVSRGPDDPLEDDVSE